MSKSFEWFDPSGRPAALQQADLLERQGFKKLASQARKNFTKQFVAACTVAKTTR